MKVTHELTVTSKCPTDDSRPDVYLIKIETDEIVLVEDILQAVQDLTADPIFQEDLTERLSHRLNAKVTTVGRHFNVVETTVEVA